MRDKGDFFYVSNKAKWGHLVSTENFNTSRINNELWEITNNRYDWEQRYLHQNYSQYLNDSVVVQSPCANVFWFPIVSERFADDLIHELESSGKWSAGSNYVSLNSFSALAQTIFFQWAPKGSHFPEPAVGSSVANYLEVK